MADQVALVSGGSLGIGAATATRLAERNIEVFVVDIAREPGEALCDDIIDAGGSATFVEQDLFADGGPGRAIERILDATSGRLDIVVNNAFAYERGDSLSDMAADVFTGHLTRLVVTYQATVAAAAAALRQSNEAAVVNLASVRGQFAGGGFGPYSVSKAAIAQMTRVLATELGPDGIRVNAVAPGVIGTARTMASSETNRSRMAFVTPAGRIGTPDDVARAITFLVSPESDFITGQVLVVDGGLTLPLHVDAVNRALEFEAENHRQPT